MFPERIILFATQSTTNKGIILPIALIIIMLAVSVITLVIADNPKRDYKKVNNKVILDESPVGRYNQFIKKYQETTEELATNIDIKIRNAVLYQDDMAINIIQTYVATANKKSTDMSDYISRAKDCIATNDVIGLNYVLQAMEADLYIFGAIIKEIKELRIQDMTKRNRHAYSESNKTQHNDYNYTNTQHQAASDISVFFKGCKTKEELTARYKNLAKTLHPDAKGGSTEAFQEMKAEYENLVKEISNGK